MCRMGLAIGVRGQTMKTAVSNAAAPCPADRLNRQFQADRPNRLWVSDFAYVWTWQGFLYVGFVIYVFARRPIGRAGPIHHSLRDAQYVGERVVEVCVEPSAGSIGDSQGNALAETINGLYKAELTWHRGSWRNAEAVKLATLE